MPDLTAIRFARWHAPALLVSPFTRSKEMIVFRSRTLARKPAARLCPPSYRRGLRLEWLEDRSTPATLFVDDSLVAGTALGSVPSSIQVTADRDGSGTLTTGDRVTIAAGETGTTANLTFNAAPNTGAGDVGSVYSTITAAIAAAAAGDTIAIAKGTYAESVAINKQLILDGLTGVASDVVIDPASGAAVTVTVPGVTLRDLRVTGATDGIVATNVASLNLSNVQVDANTGTGLTLTGTGAGATLDLSGVTLTGNTTAGATVSGFPTINLAVGGSTPATVTVTGTSVQVTSGAATGQAVNLTGATAVTITGSSAADTFVVTPPATGGPAITIDGGLPTGVMPGDRIDLTTTTGLTVTATAGANGFSGSITSGTTAAVNFSGIESFADGSTISGQVFVDTDQDGTPDGGEVGFQGATVFLDQDADNQLDAGEISATTDASGNFSIAGLPPGTYSVRLVTPTGTALTTSATPAAVTIGTLGATTTPVNFGVRSTTAASGGTVTGVTFNDANNNGTRDTGEAAVGGVTVFLDVDNDGQLDAGEASAVSGATGAFTLTSPTNGTFTLRAVPSAGFAGSSTTNVTLTGGNTITADVGLRTTATTTGTVTGFVYADVNPQNGRRDAGENGVRGITVFLDLDSDGRFDAGEPTDVTDSTGAFTLTTTQTGTFFVRAVLSPGYLRSSGFPSVTLPTTGGPATADIGLFTNLPPQATPARRLAAGFVRGGKNFVKVFGEDGRELAEREVFAGVNTRDVRVAVADVTGDGVEDVIVGTGPGVPAQVVILDGTNLQEIARLTPFEGGFTGGVFVAAGDVTGDGIADIIVSPDEGGGPRLVIYQGGAPGATGTFQQVASFFGIEDTNFRGGARVAVADINRDGIPDVIVAAGFQGGPRIAVFDGASVTGLLRHLFNDFFMFESTLRNGAFVAAGDVDGDGFGDIIGGGGPGGGPRVFALSGADLMTGKAEKSKAIANFFAGDDKDRGGIRLAAKDTDGDGRVEIFTGSGQGNHGKGKKFKVNGQADNFDVDFGSNNGVFVG
jgi:hypothetical protein